MDHIINLEINMDAMDHIINLEINMDKMDHINLKINMDMMEHINLVINVGTTSMELDIVTINQELSETTDSESAT